MRTLKLVTLLLLFNICSMAQPDGQPPRGGKMDDKIKSMKIAFITERLNLTPEESQKFWPVFNQFESEMKTLRPSRKDGPPDFAAMSDKDVEKFLDEDIARKQKEVDVMKKYLVQFKQILPVRKVAELVGAQEAFKQELLQMLQDRKRDGGNKGDKGDKGDKGPK